MAAVPPRHLTKELVAPDASFMDDAEYDLEVDADDAKMHFLDFWPNRQHEQVAFTASQAIGHSNFASSGLDMNQYVGLPHPSLNHGDAFQSILQDGHHREKHLQSEIYRVAQPPLPGESFFGSHPLGAVPPLEPTANPYITGTNWVPAATGPGIQTLESTMDMQLDYFQGPRLYHPEQLGSDYMGLGGTAASGSALRGTSSKPQVATTPSERLQDVAAERASKIKEKNRLAQQRFRERQRTRLTESEERVHHLSAAVTQLQIEEEHLTSRNLMLEKMCSVRDAQQAAANDNVGAQQSEGTARLGPGGISPTFLTEGNVSLDAIQERRREVVLPMTAEALESSGSESSDPGRDPKADKTMVTLTVRHGEVVYLTLQMIKKMTWLQHAKVWKEYVNKLAELLMTAEGDPESEAGLRVAQLVMEAIKLNSCISVCNPTGFRTFHCNRMEEDTGEGASQAPSKDVWFRIMKTLQMPDEQTNGIRQLRRLYLGRLGDVLRHRQAINAQLRSVMPSTEEGGRQMAADYLTVVDATKQLRASLKEEHRLMMMFNINITHRIGQPLQAANVIVQSYPWAPDILSIMNCLAEEMGDPPASELLAMGYHAAVGQLPEEDGQASCQSPDTEVT